MTTPSSFRRNTCVMILTVACVLQLLALPPASAQTPALQDRIQFAQARQCERRAGPFVTQDTAWQRWRQARAQGQSVSQGVVPCRDQYGTRGYCFFVFYAC